MSVRRERGARLASGHPRRARGGFTLLEVIFAVVLLGGVLLAFATFTRNFVRTSNAAGLRAAASDLAVDRVEAAKASSTYAALDTLAVTEPLTAAAPGVPAGFARVTAVRQTKTAQLDYRTITVRVTHPALSTTVTKTTVIAAF